MRLAARVREWFSPKPPLTWTISVPPPALRVAKPTEFPPAVHEYQSKHPDRSLYFVKGSCILSNEGLYEHCAKAIATGLPALGRGQPQPYTDTLLVVGSGLSVEPLLDELRERAKSSPVMAIKGAHDWLIERGITPTFAVAADPQEERHSCFEHLNDETIYLCASQMHPQTWVYMKGRKVILWHAQIDSAQPMREGWQGVPLVPGGGTTGLRALAVAWILGFRNVELYGYDSCVSPEGVKRLDGTKIRERDTLRPQWVGEREFLSSDEMMTQIQGLTATIKPLKGLKLTAHGDGLFQEVLRQGKAAGWPV